MSVNIDMHMKKDQTWQAQFLIRTTNLQNTYIDISIYTYTSRQYVYNAQTHINTTNTAIDTSICTWYDAQIYVSMTSKFED